MTQTQPSAPPDARPSTEVQRLSNYQKYQTRNPLVRKLIGGFYAQARRQLERLQPSSLLEAGCGEGEGLARLADLLPARVTAFDLNPTSVELAAARHPAAEISVQSIYEMPYPDRGFDVVMCFEVLEHLDRPEEALTELLRVAQRAVLLSVPWEPWFRIGSLLRGKYLRHLGNHPEHIQHWNPQSFERFLEQQADGVVVETAFPWLMARCTPRDPSCGPGQERSRER